jgi:hypothetical protein
MNKRILAAAVILGWAVMACGFSGMLPTATATIGSLPNTGPQAGQPTLPPLVQPTLTEVQPTLTAVPPTLTVAQPSLPTVQATQSGGVSASGLPFSDDFTNSNSGWEQGTYSDGSVGYGNGYYYVKVTTKGYDLYGASAADGITDVIISVDATQFDGPSDNNTGYGVICRLQNDSSDDGYYFRLGGDGQFSVAMYNNGSFTSLMPGSDQWQDAPSANLGNVSNHLVATCKGNQLTFSINGTVVFNGTDNTFSSGGLGLLGVIYDDSATAEFHFTSFQAKAP